jgi:hypothetical protein
LTKCPKSDLFLAKTLGKQKIPKADSIVNSIEESSNYIGDGKNDRYMLRKGASLHCSAESLGEYIDPTNLK